LSDTKVYEPDIRALLGTASHFCEVVEVLCDNVQGLAPGNLDFIYRRTHSFEMEVNGLSLYKKRRDILLNL